MTTERKRLAGAPVRASVKRKTKAESQASSFHKKARDHALEALESLASLAKSANSEAVRVSAANAVLDRAMGKPASGARNGAGVDNPAEGGLEVQWLDPES